MLTSLGKRIAGALVFLLVPTVRFLLADPPRLVKDLDITTAGSHAAILGDAGGLAYIQADSLIYRSDGTPQGTYPIANGYWTSWRTTASLGNIFLFSSGAGLTRTDGTVAGTYVLKASSDSSSTLARLGSYVYFDGGRTPTTELWRTDGSPSGTALFKSFAGGGRQVRQLVATRNRIFFHTQEGAQTGLFSSDGSSNPAVYLGPHFIQPDRTFGVGDRLFFATSNPPELWVSDGTAQGTVRLRTFSRELLSLTPVGDRLLFVGHSEAHGEEPWVSDGTVEGTVLLHDLEPGPNSSGFLRFGPLGPIALFLHRGNLWRTDGTSKGTQIVKMGLNAQTVVAGKNRAVLSGRALSGFPTIYELWVTDGTEAGTVLLRSTEESESADEFRAVEIAGRIQFPYVTRAYGAEIWETDGTASGTRLFVDFQTATNGGHPVAITAGLTRAYFLTGFLWSTDGTEAGTHPVTKNGSPIPASQYGSIVTRGDEGYSCGEDALWRTDGTDAGTLRLSPSGHACRWIVRAGDDLFFGLVATSTGSTSLWKSNGLPEGTALVRGTLGATWGAVPYRNGILFNAGSGPTGTEPWTSDGTFEGTHLVKDVVPGPQAGVWSSIVAVGETAYFQGGLTGFELWKTDGTEVGTSRVMEGLEALVLAGRTKDILCFFGRLSGMGGFALWRTDGTPEGTRVLRSFTSGSLLSDRVDPPVSTGDRVFFLHTEGGHRLWSSDGTPEGTLPLTPTTGADGLSVVPGGLAFVAAAGIGITSGTVEGTRFVGVARFPFGSSGGPIFARLGSMLLFAGHDADHGDELWRADIDGGGRMFYTVVPCRVVDTRIPEDGPPILDGATREIAVAGRCGVPIDAAGVVLNATVSGSTGDGYIEVGPARRGPTGTRSTSFRAGQTRASSMVLGLDPASQGMVSVRLFAPGYADVILDVSGYFR